MLKRTETISISRLSLQADASCRRRRGSASSPSTMTNAFGRTAGLGSEGSIDIHLFQIVGFADFLVRGAAERRDAIVGHDEAAVRSRQVILHQVGVVRCEDGLRVEGAVQLFDDCLGGLVMEEGVEFVDEDECGRADRRNAPEVEQGQRLSAG